MQALVTLLLAAALLAALAHVARRAAAGELKPTPDTVAAILFALVVVGLGVGRIGDFSNRLKEPVAVAGVAPNLGIDDDALVAGGVDVGFIQFAASKIAADEHFVVVCSGACDDTKRFLTTFRLTPRVPELDVAKADWIVFLDVAPAASTVPASQFDDQQNYSDTLAIARVKR